MKFFFLYKESLKNSLLLDNQVYKNIYVANGYILKSTVLIFEKQKKKLQTYNFSFIFITFFFSLARVKAVERYKGKKARFGNFYSLGCQSNPKPEINTLVWNILSFWSRNFIPNTKLNEVILCRIPPKFHYKRIKTLTFNFNFDLTDDEKELNPLFFICIAPMFFTKISFQILFSTQSFVENFVSLGFLALPFKQARSIKKQFKKFNLKKNKKNINLIGKVFGKKK